jgi:hypothetical protein
MAVCAVCDSYVIAVEWHSITKNPLQAIVAGFILFLALLKKKLFFLVKNSKQIDLFVAYVAMVNELRSCAKMQLGGAIGCF